MGDIFFAVQTRAAGFKMGEEARIDVDSPLWDQTTFTGLGQLQF